MKKNCYPEGLAKLQYRFFVCESFMTKLHEWSKFINPSSYQHNPAIQFVFKSVAIFIPFKLPVFNQICDTDLYLDISNQDLVQLNGYLLN